RIDRPESRPQVRSLPDGDWSVRLLLPVASGGAGAALQRPPAPSPSYATPGVAESGTPLAPRGTAAKGEVHVHQKNCIGSGCAALTFGCVNQADDTHEIIDNLVQGRSGPPATSPATTGPIW